MKYIIIAFLFLGCASHGTCPHENMIIISPYSGMPVRIYEGFFDNPDQAYTEDEFNSDMDDLRREYERLLGEEAAEDGGT